MQAIILAAGKGTRMRDLVNDKPKHLLEVGGMPILKHTISVLPKEVSSVVVVIGYLGEKIKEVLGDNFDGVEIKYVDQKELLGTAYAVWLARPLIKEKRFIVLGGDDWYGADDLERCVREELAIGVFRMKGPTPSAVRLKEDGYFDGLETEITGRQADQSYKATGVYVLDKEIFDYEPVKIGNGETGLPQTIALMARSRKVKAVEMPRWRQVNTPEDLEALRREFEG
ncbi:MAG: nucleotidyltransferase family protein [Microgenomates group bacterium]